MHSHHHHAGDVRRVRFGILVVSDTRTLQTDTAGKEIAASLQAAGHEVVDRRVVPDDGDAIRHWVRRWTLVGVADDLGDAAGGRGTEPLQALVVTGGTGIAPRDRTPETLEPLFERTLPGFGEHFRHLSWQQVGVKGLLSRATAGVVGQTLVFALPGSARGCALAVEALILPMVQHAVGLLWARESTKRQACPAGAASRGTPEPVAHACAAGGAGEAAS